MEFTNSRNSVCKSLIKNFAVHILNISVDYSQYETQKLNSSISMLWMTSCFTFGSFFTLQVKILEDLVLSYTESLKEHSLYNKDGELRWFT